MVTAYHLVMTLDTLRDEARDLQDETIALRRRLHRHPEIGNHLPATREMVLESLGVEPIKFQSAANAKAQMSTESKVFSIYATGIVKSGKRETRTRVHAIIDYRGAPPPGQPIAPTGTGGTSGLGPTPAANGIQTPPTGTGGTDPNALQNAIPGATRPNPAGNVVYFRLD